MGVLEKSQVTFQLSQVAHGRFPAAHCHLSPATTTKVLFGSASKWRSPGWAARRPPSQAPCPRSPRQ